MYPMEWKRPGPRQVEGGRGVGGGGGEPPPLRESTSRADASRFVSPYPRPRLIISRAKLEVEGERMGGGVPGSLSPSLLPLLLTSYRVGYGVAETGVLQLCTYAAALPNN